MTDIVEMRPLREATADTWADIGGVLTDIDDTLTDEGRVAAEVYAAMERLRGAGLLVVPITGRPAGWCDLIARQWPVDAVVGENGAFYFRYDTDARRMIRAWADAEPVRAANKARLEAIARDVLAEVPGAAVAADQAYRETDLAIDFCEDVAPPLSDDAVRAIVDIFKRHGATAKVSSIHVNGWFGAYDKLTMTARLLGEQFGEAEAGLEERFVFVGDSPNDAPMFRHFDKSVGVANLRPFMDRCEALPAWITGAERGVGFCEVAERILEARAKR